MPEQSSNCLFPVANVTDILNCTPDRTEGETAVRRRAQHGRGLGGTTRRSSIGSQGIVNYAQRNRLATSLFRRRNRNQNVLCVATYRLPPPAPTPHPLTPISLCPTPVRISFRHPNSVSHIAAYRGILQCTCGFERHHLACIRAKRS